MLQSILFSLFAFWIFLSEATHHSQGQPPEWVKPHDILIDSSSSKPSQVNIKHLLIDSQKNFTEKTIYIHFANKVLSQSGVERVSQIKVNFDPLYSHVVMHHIRIFRDDAWHDRLEKARSSLIQRETELERNLYSGNLTLVYFLDDIREGDIIEYAYSIIGCNPLAASHYTDWVYMQRDFAADKITHRLLADPSLQFSSKIPHENISSRCQTLSPSLCEWIWEATDMPPYEEERNQPIWYDPPAHIQMSEYPSWEDVALTILPLYHLPDDACSEEMQKLTEKWQQSTTDASKRALLALRFVQDEIRYLGFEEGMGAFQPTEPKITFDRRFGDCKDKAFLLHTLLKSMNISSKMVLVHTDEGKLLADELPTPFAFNHIVLQIELTDGAYFVDPTFCLQGGSLEKNFFPDYHWGLILTKEKSPLTPLPKPIVENPTEIESQFNIIKEDEVHFFLKNTFHFANADKLRRLFSRESLDTIEKNSLGEIQDVYGLVSPKSGMEILDDRENNVFTVTESYILPTQLVQEGAKLDLMSYTIYNYLSSSINPQRTSPYEIYENLWIKERIQVETPFISWTPFEGSSTKSNEAFLYNHTVDIKNHQACFNFELKHLKDHIPQSVLYDSWKMMREISKKGFPSMIVAAPPVKMHDLNFLILAAITALIGWILFSLILRKKRPTQDGLSFQLRKSQAFYLFLNVSTLLAFGPDLPLFAIFSSIFILTIIFHFILTKRSTWLITLIQCCIAMQTCMVALFLFIALPSIHPAQKCLAIMIYSLYSASILIALYRAKTYLIREKGQQSAALSG